MSTAIVPQSKITELLQQANISVKVTKDDLIDLLIEEHKEMLEARIATLQAEFERPVLEAKETMDKAYQALEAHLLKMNAAAIKTAKKFLKAPQAVVRMEGVLGYHSAATRTITLTVGKDCHNYITFEPALDATTQQKLNEYNKAAKDCEDFQRCPVGKRKEDYENMCQVKNSLYDLEYPQNIRAFRKRFVEEVLAQTTEGRQLLDKLRSTARGKKTDIEVKAEE